MMLVVDWPIKTDMNEIRDRIVELRRDFHMNPELGNEEFRTSGIVARVLEHLGLEVKRGIAGTGVVALLKGGKGGKTVALRADMDALPIQDLKNKEYSSRVAGKMHACGHDAHTAMLLGAAMVLAEMRDRIRGAVKFVFQPAEENTGGAFRMIREGVLDDPRVDAIFGLHVSPEIETGWIGIRRGISNARSDAFKVVVNGSAAHGASPDKGVDAIVIAAQAITALQSIVSRHIDPLEPAVLTIGTVSGGTQDNIVADRVEFTGTVRTMGDDVRDMILGDMERIIRHICRGMGGGHEFEVKPGYPLLVNDHSMAELVGRAAVKIVGERVIDVQRLRLGVEDFAYYLQRVPGAFWRLGTGNRHKGVRCIPHNPYFDIDEDALIIGTAIHVQVVLDFLGLT